MTIIMDGNGRWANAQGLNRTAGREAREYALTERWSSLRLIALLPLAGQLYLLGVSIVVREICQQVCRKIFCDSLAFPPAKTA
ncbi:hypothetical protein HMPREF0580_1108 [Mobiluncus mulieris ATCC 35239]|uniref:Ditrans,polycis-undecaprenyl-diphosphate synthase ((2E,6E)-farnesyl-diphosphate specific) n=1 Tax=Mobiluncus mulieris ATCC 35239 TaxID=871571 RepID=E0QQE3_9ACTO|nr:hypothetical protein HMPREF0580_1108 [Mobiluncus mulieris ATCC 35239]